MCGFSALTSLPLPLRAFLVRHRQFVLQARRFVVAFASTDVAPSALVMNALFAVLMQDLQNSFFRPYWLPRSDPFCHRSSVIHGFLDDSRRCDGPIIAVLILRIGLSVLPVFGELFRMRYGIGFSGLYCGRF